MKTTARILLCAAFMAAATQASTQTKTYRISPADSKIGFVATKWMVFKEEGKFKNYEGTIEYDAKNPSSTKVRVTIQTSSVDSRDRDRDQVIRGESLLDANRFPTMTFASDAVRPGSRDTLIVSGTLTIRGVTRRVSVPVRMLGIAAVPDVGHLAGFEAEFVIDRFEYGVAGSPNLIGKDIVIQMQIGSIAR